MPSLLLSGCARAFNPSLQAAGAAAASPRANSHNYKLLYSFGGTPDGQDPTGVGVFNGSLYGATFGGGDSGYGSVFGSSLSGKEKVLYSFTGGNDGLEPYSALTEFHGSLYGVTYTGGGTGCRNGTGCGTVYSLDSSNRERIVHRFKPNKTDGWFPATALVPMNGVLYGATAFGYEKSCGSYGCGRVYSIDASGKERIIYRFKGGTDGCWANGLVALKGVLYGITQNGGTSSGCGAGAGIVFSLTAAGQETVLHRFKGTPDGSLPTSLIAANGMLYGTTYYGGSSSCEGGNRPCGVVFSLTRSGHEKVLYRFQGYSDGSAPDSVIWLNHELYGTTASGGSGSGLGFGTIFGLTLSGTKTTLYDFQGVPDGLNPRQLTYMNGTLYGITGQGGTGTTCGGYGCGTIFKIAP